MFAIGQIGEGGVRVGVCFSNSGQTQKLFQGVRCWSSGVDKCVANGLLERL